MRTSVDLTEIRYEDLKSYVDFVNANNLSWQAQLNPRFSGMTLAEMKKHNKRP